MQMALSEAVLTLLVALKGAAGLVLAADSRGTFGDPRGITAQNDAMQKTAVLAPHVGVLMAGSSELGVLIVQKAVTDIQAAGVDGATAAMEQLRQSARDLYGGWFPTLSAVQIPMPGAASRPDATFVVGGYDQDATTGEYTIPKIYQLTSSLDFPPMLHDYGFAVAGVPQYALYLLNRLYEADRNASELTALATYAITETASQDGKVGGPVRVLLVTPTGGCVALADDDIAKVISRNEARATALKESFFERTV